MLGTLKNTFTLGRTPLLPLSEDAFSAGKGGSLSRPRGGLYKGHVESGTESPNYPMGVGRSTAVAVFRKTLFHKIMTEVHASWVLRGDRGNKCAYYRRPLCFNICIALLPLVVMDDIAPERRLVTSM